MDPIPITTLTSAAVQQNLQSDGLDTLGLATLSLSPRWSDTTPNIIDYKSDKLTLNISALRAPYRGILEFAFSPVASTLASNITESDTILNVAAGDGNKFPNPSGGSYLLTLSNMSGSKMEVVECIGRTGDAFTVTRGANGTAKQVFGSGDKVALRLGENARIDSYYGANGNPLCGIGAIYRLHPQAALRLETIAAQRYGSPGNRSILPIPSAMVVRGPQGFIAARWFEADEVMTGIGGDISFHDQRGLAARLVA
jgi:hypothetical protein